MQAGLRQNEFLFNIILTAFNLDPITNIFALISAFSLIIAAITYVLKIILKIYKLICFYLLLIIKSNYLIELIIK